MTPCQAPTKSRRNERVLNTRGRTPLQGKPSETPLTVWHIEPKSIGTHFDRRLPEVLRPTPLPSIGAVNNSILGQPAFGTPTAMSDIVFGGKIPGGFVRPVWPPKTASTRPAKDKVPAEST